MALPSRKLGPQKSEEQREVEQMVDFVQYYAVGNICIASKLSISLPLSSFAFLCFGLGCERIGADKNPQHG